MSAKPNRNLHVPLPEALHERLRAEARRSGKPATALAREAIEAWIEEQHRLAVHEEIAGYAREMSGKTDLDAPLEEAGVEHLRRLERWNR